MKFRIGHGYDVHRISPERRMILGGVEIPCGYGLEAHSDGDVLIHALIDAFSEPAPCRISGRIIPTPMKDIIMPTA